MDLTLIGNDVLRAAIRENFVSFPSQIPAFTQRGDMRERIVQLYFVRGWEIKAVCERFGLSRSTVRKLLSDWKARAVGAGYIQEIDPEGLAALVHQGRFRESEEPEPRNHPKRHGESSWEMRAPPHSEYFSAGVPGTWPMTGTASTP